MSSELTELKLKLEERERELFEIKNRFQLVLDTIPGRVFWKDRNCVFMGCNSRFASDAGYDNVEDLKGKTDYDMAWTKSESDFFVKIDKEVMDTNTPQLRIIEPQKRPDGTNNWLETSKVPLTDINNNVIGILGTYMDITTRVENDLALKETNRQLKIKNKELEHFAYMASHDLQEPLNTIIGFIGLINSKYEDRFDEESLEFLKHINKASNRMKMLINGVLEYSRLNNDLELESFDCNKIVSEVIENLAFLINETKAKVDIQELPEIVGHKKILTLVFQNIINNALKFIKPDTEVNIDISCRKTNNHWEFRIKDNGIGIPQEYQSKIFNLFQKLHNASEYKGTGIGLSLCKKVMDIHNGEIWVISKNGEGSTFCFTIPIIDYKHGK